MGKVRLKHVVLFLLLSHQFIMTSAVVPNNRLLLAVGLATGAILSSYSKSQGVSFFISNVCSFIINEEKHLFFPEVTWLITFFLLLLVPNIYLYIYIYLTSFVRKVFHTNLMKLFRLSYENSVHCHTIIYALLTNINIQ